jgi:hypothetical protein
MNNEVQVERKSVYGVEKLYPVNALADKLAAFKGQKTLTMNDVAALKDMGFTVALYARDPGKLVGIHLGDL